MNTVKLQKKLHFKYYFIIKKKLGGSFEMSFWRCSLWSRRWICSNFSSKTKKDRQKWLNSFAASIAGRSKSSNLLECSSRSELCGKKNPQLKNATTEGKLRSCLTFFWPFSMFSPFLNAFGLFRCFRLFFFFVDFGLLAYFFGKRSQLRKSLRRKPKRSSKNLQSIRTSKVSIKLIRTSKFKKSERRKWPTYGIWPY